MFSGDTVLANQQPCLPFLHASKTRMRLTGPDSVVVSSSPCLNKRLAKIFYQLRVCRRARIGVTLDVAIDYLKKKISSNSELLSNNSLFEGQLQRRSYLTSAEWSL